jgi:hypothetical protein
MISEVRKNKLRVKLRYLRAELVIRERFANQSVRGYRRVLKMIEELENKLNGNTNTPS